MNNFCIVTFFVQLIDYPPKITHTKFNTITVCIYRENYFNYFKVSHLPHTYIYIYIYIDKFRYTPMITSQNSIRNVSVATDEEPSPKLALSEGGSRGNIES